ncbi:MAG: SRPBCC family protein [Acidimicrobiales bacterium]
MRMSDQPSVTVETTISASPERIFDLVSDLDVMSSFDTEFHSGEWSSGRPGAVGSTFVGRQRMGDREWETTSTVSASDPGRTFAWKVGDADDVGAIWTFTFRSVPKGTEVTYSFVHGPGSTGLRSRIEKHPEQEEEFIEARLTMLQQNMVKTLEGVRRRVGG